MNPSAPDPRGVRKLRDLQRAFATGVTRPLTTAHRMQSKWVDGKPACQAVAVFIKPNDRSSSFERLEIYNKQYWFRLIDSFYEDFPGLRTLIGEKRFYDLSIAYLTKYPSTSFALSELGCNLEKFLAREPQWIAPHADLARDLVRLEWAHIVAFDREALPPINIDDLLDSDPTTLRLAFQPHITFLACEYPIDDYIVTVRRREEPQGETSNAVSERVKRKAAKKLQRPKAKKICLAVHRSENSVYYKRLEPEAYLICTSLQKGLTLQGACEKAFRRRKADPDFSATLQGWFAQWASFGWFCRVE